MKYYAVKVGRKIGIYYTWDDCKEQVNRFPNAKYKSFKTVEEANSFISGTAASKKETINPQWIIDSLNCDGAYSSLSGVMEFKIQNTQTGAVVLDKSYSCGTNNIAEFLGLVRALQTVKNSGNKRKVIYTDSRTAIAWVNNRWINTSFDYTQCPELFKDINECLLFLESFNKYEYNIQKWDTKSWGEIPSDYGRK